MLLPTLLSTGSLVLTASAFLIPPEITDKATISSIKVPFISHLVDYHKIRILDLECTTCPVFLLGPSNNVELVESAASFLFMEFASNPQGVFFNNVPIYPNTLNAMAMPVTARQQLRKTDETIKQSGYKFKSDVQLSYSIEVLPREPYNGGLSTVINIQILGIEGVVVNVDSIRLQVYQTLDGEILDHVTSTVKSTLSPEAKQCASILCRIRAIIAAKIGVLKGAVAKKVGSMRGCAGKQDGRKAHGGFVNRKGPGHPRHRHHSALHRALYMARRFFRQVFVPIFIGVAAGMAASAIGMLIVQIGVLLWMRFRRSRGIYEPVQQVEVVDDELPKYEDLDKKIALNEKEEKEEQFE